MANLASQEEFEREFLGQIQRHRPALVRELGSLIVTPVPAALKILHFEIFSYWDRFPVQAFAMDDESPDEVYFEPPFRSGILEGVGALIPRGAIDQDGYEDDGVATLETGARKLAEWFSDCWHEAGGARFPVPAYIGHHDRSAQFDLMAMRWVEFGDIWY